MELRNERSERAASLQASLPGLDDGDLLSPSREQPLLLFFGLFPPAENAAVLAQRAEELRMQHRLRGQKLVNSRLHVTLRCVAARAGQARISLQALMEEGAIRAAGKTSHSSLPVKFDHAMSFAGRPGSGKLAFVLTGEEHSAASELGQGLDLAIRRENPQPRAGSLPHMTLHYDRRVIEKHSITPISWTAHEFALVLSHIGKTRHECLGRWALK